MLIPDNPHYVERKWGYFLKFIENEPCTVKVLSINKGESISYQYHNFRSEQWFVISGRVWITKGIVSQILLPGQAVTIDKKEKHKMEGVEDSLVLEISKGFFDEQDIVRV